MAHGMWTGEHGTQGELHGRHTHATRMLNSPQALSRPRVPIMIGGGGEKRTLRLVAQYADMCNVSGGPETLARKLEILRGHCADVGRDPNEVTTTRMGTLVLTPDADETARVNNFLSGLMGEEFEEQFVVGEPADIVPAVEALVATGVDVLIFNMPLSVPDDVVAAGELLTKTFA